MGDSANAQPGVSPRHPLISSEENWYSEVNQQPASLTGSLWPGWDMLSTSIDNEFLEQPSQGFDTFNNGCSEWLGASSEQYYGTSVGTEEASDQVLCFGMVRMKKLSKQLSVKLPSKRWAIYIRIFPLTWPFASSSGFICHECFVAAQQSSVANSYTRSMMPEQKRAIRATVSQTETVSHYQLQGYIISISCFRIAASFYSRRS